MSDLVITSPANPRLKALSALRRRRVREAQGVTLVEGFEELELALDSGVAPQTLFVCPALMADADAQSWVIERSREVGAEVIEVGRAAFERAAYREGPDGFLAIVGSLSQELANFEVPDDALLLICEGVEKPGNLGAMLRTADAAGWAQLSPLTRSPTGATQTWCVLPRGLFFRFRSRVTRLRPRWTG
ncbi:hypothetical protein [Ornithinimicrobium sp. INDO-MA30-4]|uniref:TrmH family RNA methyltransferase n=1 Tax=Ornithinimicrobium sp. INDO-MA30-4 TaxID=2908651 RepID=UPI0028834907|nr:hypothetical protein [Ornithinimicrobium sp. INDO-MA30-4]